MCFHSLGPDFKKEIAMFCVFTQICISLLHASHCIFSHAPNYASSSMMSAKLTSSKFKALHAQCK